jgi:hypothetical protein
MESSVPCVVRHASKRHRVSQLCFRTLIQKMSSFTMKAPRIFTIYSPLYTSVATRGGYSEYRSSE